MTARLRAGTAASSTARPGRASASCRSTVSRRAHRSGGAHRPPQPAAGSLTARPRQRQRRAPAARRRPTGIARARRRHRGVSFDGVGRPLAVHGRALTDGGGRPLHPFFASAAFRFTIDCDVRRLPPAAAQAAHARRPAARRRPADEGFQRLRRAAQPTGSGCNNPRVTDLSQATFERVLLDLLAWTGDLHQLLPGPGRGRGVHRDRHPALLAAPARGPARHDSWTTGTPPATVLAIDPGRAGFVPAGLQVRMPDRAGRGAGELSPVRGRRTPGARRARRLDVPAAVAAFPGAADAELPAGRAQLLLLGHDAAAARPATGSPSSRARSRRSSPSRPPGRSLAEPGWVAEPGDRFDPAHRPADPGHAGAAGPSRSPRRCGRGRTTAAAVRQPRRRPVRRAADRAGRRRRGPAAGTSSRSTSTPRRERRHPRPAPAAPAAASLRVPEWPVVHDDDGVPGGHAGHHRRAAWTAVEHLYALALLRSALHRPGRRGRRRLARLRRRRQRAGGRRSTHHGSRRRASSSATGIGDPVHGDVGLGTLTQVGPAARPAPTSRSALDALGAICGDQRDAGDGRPPAQTLDRIRQDVPASLRHHGPLQRAVVAG